MNNLNSLILEGNLVKDAELMTVGGTPVCKCTIAVSRWYKNQQGKSVEEVSYFDIECKGNLAKTLEEHGKEGCCIRAVGRLVESRFKHNGKNCSRVYVLAEHIEFKL